MDDSCLHCQAERSSSVEILDAFALARLPELLKKMEETAYALVRIGDTRASGLLFMAVAAAEQSAQLKANCKQTPSNACRLHEN
ncbi:MULTISPECIES: hypothetical protein [unclassified Yoonia]|uniref:hypothetical protein n=1 Tax=unclassified Yoonia TaxID=2629118 RepID=UPI002AFE5FA9|nr:MULTISPECIES: hypothetical protein [unclassified Yoonia]